MKRSLKISLYILFYIFVLLTIFAFIFIHTPYSKNKLKKYLATQVEKRTGLHLKIESLYGNLVNNVQLTNVKLMDKNKASILSVNEAEIGYNLFSIFSDSPEINSLYLNGVKIDSLPKIKQRAQSSKFHMKLPEVYIENLRYSQKANLVFSVLYGQLNISPQHNSIQIDTGSVKIASVNEKFDIGELKASLRGDTVQLEKAKIYNRAARIDLKGFYEFVAQNGRLDIAGRDIRVHNRLPGLSRLVNTEDFVNVSSKTQIESGSISSEINFSGKIRNQNITRGQAYLTISDNNISVPNLEFQSQDELFTGSLQGDLSGNIVSELNIHNLDLKKWQFLGRETSLSGKLTFRNSRLQDAIAIKINLSEGSVQNVNFNEITGAVSLVDDKFEITDSILVAIDGSEMNLSGFYNIPDKSLQMSGGVRSSDLAFFSPITKMDSLSGRINGRFKVNGKLSSPDISCQVLGNNLSGESFYVGQARINLGLTDIANNRQGALSVQGTNGRITKLEPDLKQFEVALGFSGDTTFVNTLNAKGEEFDLNCKGQIYQSTDFLVDRLSMEARNTNIYSKESFHITRRQDTISISRADFAFGENAFYVSGQFVGSKPRDLTISLDNINMAPLHALNKNIPSNGDLDGKIQYIKKEIPSIEIQLQARNVVFKDMNFPRVVFNSTVREDTIQLQNANFMVDENSSINLQGNLTCNFPTDETGNFLREDDSIDIDINYDNFPVEYLNKIALKRFDLAGRLTGNLSVHNTLKKPVINTIFKVEKPGFNRIKGEYLRARGHYESDSLTFNEFELDEGGGHYNGKGYLPISIDLYSRKIVMRPNEEMDMEFSAMTSTLPFISAPPNNSVEEIAGDFFISMDVTGTRENPVKEGYFVAENASINLSPLENPIRDVSAQGTMRNNILHIDRCKANMIKQSPPEITRAKSSIKRFFNSIFSSSEKQSEKKNLTVSGNINLEKFIRPGYDLKLKGKDLYFRTLLAEGEGFVNGDFEIDGRDTVDISGEMEVSKMILRKSFRKDRQPVKRRGGGPFTRFNIHTIIPGNFYISNDQMNCELTGDLWVLREGNNPWRFSGDLSILEGSFYYFGWEFTNLSGTVYFDPVKMNPRLDINSQLNLTSFTADNTQDITEDDEVVDVYLTGDLEKPDLQFESANYSQNDILSLILGSQTQSGESTSTIPGGALNVFGQYFERQIERRFSQFSGIDRISFQTNSNLLQQRNLDNWEITLGQRITPNIFVTYEQGAVYSKQTQRVEVEYRFDQNHSIEGNVDQDGLFGINYKIRYNY